LRARKDRQSLFKLVSELAATVITSVEDIASKGIRALKKEPARLAIKDAGKLMKRATMATSANTTKALLH